MTVRAQCVASFDSVGAWIATDVAMRRVGGEVGRRQNGHGNVVCGLSAISGNFGRPEMVPRQNPYINNRKGKRDNFLNLYPQKHPQEIVVVDCTGAIPQLLASDA